MRILFVKLGAIGDIIHTLPALAHVRSIMPDAAIGWVAEKRSAEILRGNPLIDELIEVDTRAMREGSLVDDMIPEIRRQIGGLRKVKYDIAIDFQGLLKSAAIAKLSGSKRRWGFSRRSLREPASRVVLTDTVDVPTALHVIEKNLRLASTALDLPEHHGKPEFPVFTTAEHREEAASVASLASGGRYALLNPAGGWVTKLWPAENYGALAALIHQRTGITPIIVAGPKESELAERAVAADPSRQAFAASPSLKGFFELARGAQIYIGGDTGPTHLAIAAGAPIVGIFGPTEWWRNGSTNPADICVERTDIECRLNCHRRTCGEWICMDISPSAVLDAVVSRLETAQRSNTSKFPVRASNE